MQNTRTSQGRKDVNYENLASLDLNLIYRRHKNSNVNADYDSRESRNFFAAEQVKSIGLKKILNIGGGGRKQLSKYLDPSFTIFDVDLSGEVDLAINLDQVKHLPFEDKSFDLCCAFDVLEYLENFHLINAELLRVTKSTILISLPNSAAEIFPNVVLNRQKRKSGRNRGVFSRFYGLPLEPPVDRHRWWLYFHDIVRYYYWFSLKERLELEFWTQNHSGLKRAIAFLAGEHLRNTFLVPHIWVKLRKID